MEKTISIICNRYINNMDTFVEIIYRGTKWSINTDVKDYPLLEIYKGNEMIAAHKSWDHVRFSDEIVKEGEI